MQRQHMPVAGMRAHGFSARFLRTFPGYGRVYDVLSSTHQEWIMLICRAAIAADLAALWPLRTRAVRASCAAHYPATVIETWSASAPPTSLAVLVNLGSAVVAEEDGALAGFAVLDLASGEVDAVFVEPAYQGRRIARDLLRWLEGLAQGRGVQRLFLSASLNAVAFYERPDSCGCATRCTRIAAGSASRPCSWKRCCHPHAMAQHRSNERERRLLSCFSMTGQEEGSSKSCRMRGPCQNAVLHCAADYCHQGYRCRIF
jgi:putative acetyltransferase